MYLGLAIKILTQSGG